MKVTTVTTDQCGIHNKYSTNLEAQVTGVRVFVYTTRVHSGRIRTLQGGEQHRCQNGYVKATITDFTFHRISVTGMTGPMQCPGTAPESKGSPLAAAAKILAFLDHGGGRQERITEPQMISGCMPSKNRALAYQKRIDTAKNRDASSGRPPFPMNSLSRQV